MYHTGFDVHDTNIQIEHMDEDGALGISKKIPANARCVLEFLDLLDGLTTITIEASGSYWWLHQLLEKHPKVSAVNIVDARRMCSLREVLAVQAGYGRASNDRIDAQMSAEATRRQLAPKIYVPTPEQLKVRTLVRHRTNLVAISRQFKLRGGSLLKFHGIKIPLKTLEAKDFEKMPSYVAYIINQTQKLITVFDDAIEPTENLLDELLPVSHPQIQRLITAPGIGIVCARIITVELLDIKYFNTPNNLFSYSGIAPVVQDSNEKVKGTVQLNKYCNRYLKFAFILAAHNARNHPKYKRKYEQDVNRCGKMVAVLILARRIAKSVYWMLARQQPFHM